MAPVTSSTGLLWICSLFVAVTMVTGQIENLETTLMCEGQGLRSIGCANNQVVNVRTAFWGRGNDASICPHESVTGMEECSQENAYLIFREMCNGRKKCDFEVVRSVFGEICPDVHKFLYLTYNCVDCVNEHYSDLECEMWSRQGECGGASYDWMSLNCRKTCERCAEYAPDFVNHHPNNTECDVWAESGECRNNPSYMLTYCRESCITPVTRTSCARNRHDDDINRRDCQRWADEGQCQINNHYMFWDCTKSCFGCHDDDKIRCSNKYFNETACELWAANGDCDTDPGWMIPNCLKTCLRCEADPVCKNVENDTNCAYWESIGECENNTVWMHENCWKSCIACTNAEDELTDCSVNAWDMDRDADNCDARYEQGMCSTNSSTMLTECTKSCFGCDPEVDDRIRCENKVQDSDCERWAEDGECGVNPGFMIPNCLKACISCESDPVCDNVEDDLDCEYWASIGECTKNPRYMHQMCWSSCMNCDVDLKCVNANTDIDCEYWMRFGGCGSDNHLQPRVMDFCAASCAKCDPTRQGLPGCKDSFDDCEYWGENNFCATNPIWMVHYCRKTCTHCDLGVDITTSTSTTTTSTSTTTTTTQATSPTTTTMTPHTETITTTTEPTPTTPPTSTTSTTTTMTPHTDRTTTTTEPTPTPPTTTTSATTPHTDITTTTTSEPPPTTSTTATPPTRTPPTTTTSATTPHTDITTTTTSEPPPTTSTTTTPPTTTTSATTTTTSAATTTTSTTTTSATTTTVSQDLETDKPISGEVIESGADLSSEGWTGVVNAYTRRRTFITPFTVEANGTLRAFRVRLVGDQEVDLEVWRLNETTRYKTQKFFERVYKQTIQYDASPDEPLTLDVSVPMMECVEVKDGDLIGFSTYSSTAPLDSQPPTRDFRAFTFFKTSTYVSGSFRSMLYGFDFGISVKVEPGGTC